MGQAFSTANLAFCRSDVASDVYNHLGGWDYDRICTAWASFFTSSEEENADGTPAVFVADLAKFQRITGLSKKAAQQLSQVFNVRRPVKSFSNHRFISLSARLSKARSVCSTEDTRQVRCMFPMLEILVVVVVLGNLKRVTKLSLLFSLFSLDGVLSEAEFLLMCYFVFRGMAMAVKRPVPGYSFVEPFVLATFDDLQNERCSEESSCSRSSSTASTGSAATSAGTTGCLPSKRNSSIEVWPRSSCGRGPKPKKRCSMSEIEVALARLQKMQEETEPSVEQPRCYRREMTFREFLYLTLGPGSALDLIFKKLHGDCPLTIAARLDFTRSLQFQTRLFQNVFLVQQWLQIAGSEQTTNKVVRLTAVLSVCLDLAEKSAEIIREVYSVVAADRRMALHGMACMELPFSCSSQCKQPEPHTNTPPEEGVQAGTSSATQHQRSPLPQRESSSFSAKATASAPKYPRRLPASVLASLLAEQHFRRQVRHWWPEMRIETTLDGMPEQPRVFRRLMDVISGRLYGNLVCGSSTVRCHITHTNTLQVKSIIQGEGREPWVEAAVTQGLDTGRGPPVRVIAEVDTKRVFPQEKGSDTQREEIVIELPDVRDNYYLDFVVKSRASDNEVVTVGRGSILLSAFAEEKTWIHTFIPIEPLHSPAASFASEDPEVGCSLLLETQTHKDAIECNPLRLNALNFHIRDVVLVEHCALYLCFENGHSTSVGATGGSSSDIHSVALSVGIAYRGKPVGGILFFPFAEDESLVGLSDYGCLKTSFWKNIRETHIKLPPRPACAARQKRCSVRGVKGSLGKEYCECTSADVTSSARGRIESTSFHGLRKLSSSSGDPEKLGTEPIELKNFSRGLEQHPNSSVHREFGVEKRKHQLSQYSSEFCGLYASTASRYSTDSGNRDSTSRAGRYSTGSVYRSGFPLPPPQDRTKIYKEPEQTRIRCFLPTGNTTVPLRFLRPQEFFDRSPPAEGATHFAFCTEEEKHVLQLLTKELQACSGVSCCAGIAAKTACVVRGTAHTSCQLDVTDYRCLCGSDAIIRAVGGCIFNSIGQEIQYDGVGPTDVQDECVILTSNRQALHDSLATESNSE